MSQTERPDPLAEPEGYGSKLGRLEHLTRPAGQTQRPAHVIGRSRVSEVVAGVTPGDDPEFAGDGGCTWHGLKDQVRCDQPRDWCLLLGDMAEHINPLDLCTAHLKVVASVPRFWCTLCKLDMKLEKVGSAHPITIVVTNGQGRHEEHLLPEPGGVVWLDKADWPVGLGQERNKHLPPERLF